MNLLKGKLSGRNNVSTDDSSTHNHSNNFIVNFEDSGIATSADAHSLDYDDNPQTPPPTTIHQKNKQGDQEHHVCNNNHYGKVEAIKKSAGPPSFTSFNSNASTIRQHYYPEGGWGWIVIFIGIVVQLLTHGIQMSYGVLILCARTFFKNDQIVSLGKVFCHFSCMNKIENCGVIKFII